ncbi:hypothetical protein KIW84_031461 [Lathyrus oleraceus]|uniref:H15 domain-containing protein n=1 Tax=Pisum sativum TaxID=3888 RepID=A0A9D4XUZ5_PEA|nr:hypothetical protein KIW84_031461 [Pisum sativum]
MIKDGIVSLKEKNGSSQYAIVKFIKEKQKQLLGNFKKLLLQKLKKNVASGKLAKVKGSFKLSAAAKKPVVAKPKSKLGSTSVIQTRKEELKKAEYRICELGRMLDKSLMDKKEIKLDFEAQIHELRDAMKKCEEKLSREILQKEEAERNCHHLRY